MKLMSAITLMSFFAAPALAAEGEWTTLAPDTTARLISSDTVSQDGTVWMGIEIQMPSDTKTYWRIPGESGVPLALDISGSTGIENATLAWPYPLRETRDGYLDHVYYGHVVIPFSVSVTSERPNLVADISLGICSDVCVPAMASLELVPTIDEPDAANTLRLRQALAQVPLAHSAEAVFGSARFDPASGYAEVEINDPAIEPGAVIAEIEGKMAVFGVPERSGDGAFVFPLMGRIDAGALEGAQLKLTFDTPDGPFETTRPLSLAR